MKCPNIEDLQFSSSSALALKEIKNINDLSKMLAVATGVGSLINIFAGNGVGKSAYSIYSHDFETMSRGILAIPAISRKRISDISFTAHQKVTSYKEKLFWKAIYLGCKVE